MKNRHDTFFASFSGVTIITDVWRNPIPLSLVERKGNIDGFGLSVVQRAANLKRGVVSFVHKKQILSRTVYRLSGGKARRTFERFLRGFSKKPHSTAVLRHGRRTSKMPAWGGKPGGRKKKRREHNQ